ncbi:MAG: Asp-tRNA(Asn)/Glu-tRNA(Gln) amidotransferase subunit GatB [Ignavibacteriales bacterium]|nr:Asp-tRNA(Asn)/Glu-tRNA(Gln) amidotransferase subunit GatB [Ignavibacteriales bacterium]MCF8305856.1 Asp-tRNA(Asn)/Glu-tRNA(Gln) amidotransferase subunit GatB [Ignavibacteriales bacterium]MCF8315578.1 Asp-tRNA(Asn)/Glu-tRNA(Gln) amidotransferase subunit GatB [Ignavibacteriales bacterium]MCF8436892.1 Asp-tRNA(Asn)/Glu-tRNA(Gln) amidotransferase subunit GatB [Ignavibacteriales bacterium]
MNQEYEVIIGLEVHAQLSTNTKLFCGCSAAFGAEPNTNICPVCLGHPGALPVLNKKAVDYTVLAGTALNCRINRHSVFARKNYFYPDLPKGYQISQFEEPFCENGFLEINIDGLEKKIGITRIHLEEDAGKSIHDQGWETKLDLNRCGVPLIEIVSEPDLRSAREAYEYMFRLRQIVTYLGVCDGNMEEGSLRCDANVSLRPKGTKTFGTRTEIKNLNSFRHVEKAIEYEIGRQKDILENGGKIIQETLLWDSESGIVNPMRGKEESDDYRYFPDPDLLPVVISDEWHNNIISLMPELPAEKIRRYTLEYILPAYDAEVLTSSRETAEYFEAVIRTTKDYKSASNWIMTEVMRICNETKTSINNFPVNPESLARMINLISDGTISGKIAKDIFPIMVAEGKEPEQIIKEKNLIQISDSNEIERIINSIIEINQSSIEEFRSGKEKLFGFFVGQVMKETGGKANPKVVTEILKKKLSP